MAQSKDKLGDQGESETARELAKGRDKVLLLLTGRESDRKALRYALNICERIRAGLEVLDVSRGRTGEPFLAEVQRLAKDRSVDIGSVRREGCIRNAMVAHTRKRRDIQLVVVESTNVLNEDCSPQEERKLASLWKRLECPLVLVSELERS